MKNAAVFEVLKDLSNQTLTQGLRRNLTTERSSVADFLTYLDEYDRRRGYETDGFRSLFKFLTDALHLAESSAAKRIAAMRVMRICPDVREMLAQGLVHLTAVYQVSKYINEDNGMMFLKDCSLRSKDWIEEYLQKRFHAKTTGRELRDVVRPISKPLPDPIYPSVRTTPPKSDSANNSRAAPSTSPEKARHPDAPLLAPLPAMHPPGTEKAVRISTDLDEETYGNLKRARDLLGAKEFGVVIGKALKLLLNKIEPTGKKKDGVKSTQKAKVCLSKANPIHLPKPRKPSRYIPKKERDAVTRRDGYRCSYISPNAHRCSETTRLQLDHITPFAKGGPSIAENLEWVCDTHNRMRARQMFGSDFIEKKIQQRRKARA